jgi:hypothetical protein
LESVVDRASRTGTATAETNVGKVKLEFEKKGDALVSKTPLPEGDGYNVVLQVRAKADSRREMWLPFRSEKKVFTAKL